MKSPEVGVASEGTELVGGSEEGDSAETVIGVKEGSSSSRK